MGEDKQLLGFGIGISGKLIGALEFGATIALVSTFTIRPRKRSYHKEIVLCWLWFELSFWTF